MITSPISKIILDDREFLVKRDDLIDPYLAGNKYRKLYTLLKTPPQYFKTIISYGGTQSNAMLAIAKMCFDKGWEFIYYTKQVSKTQKEQRYGNYYHALKLNMKHKEIPNELYRDFIASLRVNRDEKTFIIDQGGAVLEADEGLKVLADEIVDAQIGIKSLATPSGTGTTALFLALNLPSYTVYTTPCIGDVEYLKKQMHSLCDTLPKNLVILEPLKKYHFAKPYREFLDIYHKTLSSGVEFDLLYAPSMWLSLLKYTDEKILYIHSGGVSGNESMLKRYAQKPPK
jgi:1-aminocyclopropane-1-carboxylate deaminase/D-cysteine desulfhydrase-like pyridoxal-dependent ACC family enzyme